MTARCAGRRRGTSPAVAATALAAFVAACAGGGAAGRDPDRTGAAWSAPAPGATAPAAVVVDGAAAWRAQSRRLGLAADVAPTGWLAGKGLAVVVPAGRGLAGPPAAADEEGVVVLTFTAVAAPTSGATVYGWTLPPGGPRRTVVYRDGGDPAAAERVLWIDPP